MKYMGSKARIAKYIVPIIQKYIDDNNIECYYEPFVGGCNVIDKIKCKKRIGSDIHEKLIKFLQALSNGYQPPYDISEEEYKRIHKNQSLYSDELVGYVGFQLSYGAKWFGGYRRDKVGKRNYAHEAYDNVMKQASKLKDIEFKCCDFRAVSNIKNCVIYCDIPYCGTTKYATESFPYEEFYEWCRVLGQDNIILVSEYNMPEDFVCIWEMEHQCLIDSNKKSNNDKNKRIEKLFLFTKQND